VPRFIFPLVVVCALALNGSVSGVPTVGQVQPDALPFGALHTDAIAEASFMIFAPADDTEPKIKTDAPKFVKVLNTGKHIQKFGDNTFLCVTVEVAIDTSKAGAFKDEIAVTVGDTVTKLPVSATVQARKAGTPRVLVAGTPFCRYSTTDSKDYKGWTALVDTGLDVSYLLTRDKQDVLRDLDLSKFDCVLLSADALVYQTEADVKRVRAYADAGGLVVVTANHFYRGTVKGANAVLDGSGLEMLDEEPPPAQNKVTLTKDDFAADVIKAGIKSAGFFRASPIEVQKGGRVLVNAVGYDKTGLGLVATAKYGKGRMTALGESLWWAWVSEDERGQAKGVDNAKLLRFVLAPPRDE
jgi:hypothetical protein